MLFSACSLITKTILRFKYQMDVYCVTDLKHCKKSFKIVSDRLTEIYHSEKEEHNISKLAVQYVDRDKWIIERMYETDNDNIDLVEIEMTEDEKAAYDEITEAFTANTQDVRGLFSIVVTEDQVNFRSYSSYQAVYVTNAKKPAESSSEYYIEKVSGKLYQMVAK